MKKILWFRRDLNINDNTLMSIEGDVLPIFIFDTNILEKLDKNDVRVSIIFDLVMRLKENLKKINLDLAIFFSNPIELFSRLKSEGFSEVYANIDYDSYAAKRDNKVSEIIKLKRLNDCYLLSPSNIIKDDFTPYLVYTPFYNKVKKTFHKEWIEKAFKTPNHKLINYNFSQILSSSNLPLEISSIGFEKKIYDESLIDKEFLIENLHQKIKNYKVDRDYLSINGTSKISVALRFGLLNPREISRELVSLKKDGFDTEPFFREIIFREFWTYMLSHFPSLETKSHKSLINYDGNYELFEKFKNAQTGVPIIDAAITELKTTGLMHNRTRMIVASFLTKHLLLPWQWGEEFFAKYLLDYDKANNVLNWQWSAGTGIDPQPFFRIFNPYSQTKKFDKDGLYIKKYLPFLKEIPSKYLYDEEWLLNNTIPNYPKPIVIHKIQREKALGRYKS